MKEPILVDLDIHIKKERNYFSKLYGHVRFCFAFYQFSFILHIIDNGQSLVVFTLYNGFDNF